MATFDNAVGAVSFSLQSAIAKLDALDATQNPQDFAKALLGIQIAVGQATTAQQNLASTIGEVFASQKAVARAAR